MSFFEDRELSTRARLDRLVASFEKFLGQDGARIMRDTCIYVVGSGGRGEMSEHSDVDLFVARVDRPPSDVDAFLIQHAIAQALYEQGLPDPSQGGDFLRMHTSASLCERMGTPADDATNTFTARMLLLLESRPLVGDASYEKLLTNVVGAYWQNESGHQEVYQPFVLVNDIVRYWRILLLNYVAKNTEKSKELERPDRDPERRLRSYKLRLSRAMTCFSTLSALLAQTAQGGVKAEHVRRIVRQRPVERLRSASNEDNRAAIEELLTIYESFLRTTDRPKKELIEAFRELELRDRAARDGGAFGDGMFSLLLGLGASGRAKELLRYMVV